MVNSFFRAKKKITLAEQMFALRQSYPEAECFIAGHKKLIWKGNLRPSAISNTYPVALEYSIGWKPKVFVSGDGVKKIDDPDFPHVFHRDIEKNEIQLCLCYGDDFTSEMLIAETYIPWAIEWLYYYEIWLVTGEWCGGGLHPVAKGKKAKKHVEAPKL